MNVEAFSLMLLSGSPIVTVVLLYFLVRDRIHVHKWTKWESKEHQVDEYHPLHVEVQIGCYKILEQKRVCTECGLKQVRTQKIRY